MWILGMQQTHGNAKVVQLFGAAADARGDYLDEVKEVNDKLVEISKRHGEPIRAVLADLTYLVIGRDIMETIEATYD